MDGGGPCVWNPAGKCHGRNREETPTAQSLLRRKRDGDELSAAELRWWVEQVVAGGVEESQIGAMLMAMCIRGLTYEETVALTVAMAETGEKLRWDPSWPVADKHSTGGVGDKVSLVLAPALASFGLKVPMLTGRGLGHTGGTLDKLESIPGFRSKLSPDEMRAALDTAGCFVAGPTEDLAPADPIFCRIRDVTATVDNTSLLLASILSKKLAVGTNVLVLDIKVGKAAFFKSMEEAMPMATELLRVATELGVSTRAALTEMDCPIGLGIGNALEVEEAVACLRGQGSEDLIELVAVCGSLALVQKGLCGSVEKGAAAVREAVSNGEALKRFRSMLACQGVSEAVAEQLCFGDAAQVLPSVPRGQVVRVTAARSGVITGMDALALGEAVWALGAGRCSADQYVDPAVGVRLLKRRGQAVAAGEPWAEVHHGPRRPRPDTLDRVRAAVAVEPGEPFDPPSRVLAVL